MWRSFREMVIASIICKWGTEYLNTRFPLPTYLPTYKVFISGYLGKISSRLRHKTALRTDNRIRLMNEVIQSIEAIKMYAWEKAFAGIIGHARRYGELQFIICIYSL